MDPSLYAAFVLASAVLMVIPGPNVALIVANSMAFGTRHGLLTVAGTASAMVIQLALFALGMTAALTVLAQWFEWLRWLGVAYLVWLGLRQWMAEPVDLTRTRPDPRPFRQVFWRGALVSMTNPKTLIFYGAFFPQFLRPGPGLGRQIALLSVTFVAVALLLDGAWAVLAGRLRFVLGRYGRARNRVAGGLLMGAGAGLALARLK